MEDDHQKPASFEDVCKLPTSEEMNLKHKKNKFFTEKIKEAKEEMEQQEAQTELSVRPKKLIVHLTKIGQQRIDGMGKLFLHCL